MGMGMGGVMLTFMLNCKLQPYVHATLQTFLGLGMGMDGVMLTFM